jgi:hypothetical protein
MAIRHGMAVELRHDRVAARKWWQAARYGDRLLLWAIDRDLLELEFATSV